MIEFIGNYGLFLAKTLTFVVAFLIILAAIASQLGKQKLEEGSLLIQNINEKFDDLRQEVRAELLSKAEYKAWQKQEKKKAKEQEKDRNVQTHTKLFVTRFDGDIKASETEPLTECINAIIDNAKPQDEVLIILDSAGGFVHSYGHAAAQIHRIREHKLKLIIAIDKCAASGGYLMACLADELIASPFAIIGSIGVVGQLPNFHRLLKKNDVDYEIHTAGEYKRTLTMFGENTPKQRSKFVEEIEVTHHIFKDYVAKHRPQVDINEVATGEHWHAMQALDKKLVDKLQTSDAYIMAALPHRKVFEISYEEKQKIGDRFVSKFCSQISKNLTTLLHQSRFFKF